MSTLETRFPASGAPLEAAVFVADHDRRARLLRYGGAAAIAFACLWLTGLGIGMLGLGDLPGVALQIPGVNAERGDRDERSRDAVTRSSEITSASVRPVAASTHSERIRPSRAVLRQAKASQRVRPASQRRVSEPRTGSQPSAQPAPAPAPVPVPVNRGWTRQGWTEPPGRVRPSPAEPVQRRGEPKVAAPTTTTTPTTPAPILPPGQQKKADEPQPTG
jgi:hypothetical protein